VRAFYASSVPEFLERQPEFVVGRLTARAGESGLFQQVHTQTSSWLQEIQILQQVLKELNALVNAAAWSILLEYPIPRRAKRIDVVLLLPGCVVVIEFKCGATSYDRAAFAQVEDYCLDLRDFHRECRDRILVPLLVATHAPIGQIPEDNQTDFVSEPWSANEEDLAEKLSLCAGRYQGEGQPSLAQWNDGEYSPTPTIIEAAQALYAGQNVNEISRCHAGIDNLTRTSDAVIRLIGEARNQSKKLICFVTGIPGAGKTLAGLNVVHNHGLGTEDLGVFLSGNGPLVRVLTEALARDHRFRTGSSLAASKRRVSTFVQNVHRFIGEYFEQSDRIPVDHVAVFDEAQRAWNAEQSLRKFKRNFSEPEIMLEVMSRHRDWAVIVALVGVGQEINTGEAGLGEWGRALCERFRDWSVGVSAELMTETANHQGLFSSVPREVHVQEETALHLDVTLRSFKGQQLSEFVDALLNREVERARRVFGELEQYPIAMTRSLETARNWLRAHQRGTRRSGLVASSGARRLLAHGLDVTVDLDVENWFLNPRDDVRSSFFLEVPATEFGIQGLELDWVGLCWGGDLVPDDSGWIYRKFGGTEWQHVRNRQTQQYIINKYRVLLTRAREGLVIWVPPGDATDLTRPPALYNKVADYLKTCGIREIADL
jgi:hypothetical protein